jgi:hypothetical protein
MESTLEYLARMNKSLANDYRTADGKFRESCLDIAGEVAKRLMAEGKKPTINWVGRAKKEYSEGDMLWPRLYSGRVRWAVHIFCMCDGQVWDPMVGKPILSNDYLENAFEGEYTPIKLFADYDEVVLRLGNKN